MTTASGADALFGVLIDSPSSLYSIGHPGINQQAITNPASAATAAAGAAGALTGKFHWRYSYGDEAGALTYPSHGTDAALTVAVGTPSLDDATFSGTFTLGGAAPMFEVEIEAEGTPDKFRWRTNDGVTLGLWTEDVSITGSAQLLGYGISVTFGATTGHTGADSWYRESALTLADQAASLTGVSVGGTGTTRRVIERTDDYGNSWAVCGTIFDNTTTIFTDDTATLDPTKVLPTVNQTSGNLGFLFVDVDSFDIDPDFSVLETAGLRGSAGRPRGIPGPIKITGSPKGDLKPAYLAPILAAGLGKPVVTPTAGSPVVRSVWAASVARRSPRTLSVFTYDGASGIPPTLLFGVACDELSVSFSGGKITDNTMKMTGANYGTASPAVKIGGAGTWPGTFVAFGSRYDALAATDDVYIKITLAISGPGGTLKFKSKVGALTTYDGPDYTLYTDADTRQTRGGTQFNDSIELADEDGINLGADVGSNRQPFTIVATEVITGDLNVGDEYQFARAVLIPGAFSGASPEPYSGAPALYVDGPRFTDAHVTLRKGGSVIDATAGSFKLTTPKKEVNSLGAGARNLQDLVNDGYFGLELTITRYLNSSEWRDMMKTDDRAVVRIELIGERIPINPGVLSTDRESLVIDIPQFAVKSAKAPKANQSTVVETITGEAEQPDNSANDLFTVTLLARQGWRFPA
jgi:hypothetical protein